MLILKHAFIKKHIYLNQYFGITPFFLYLEQIFIRNEVSLSIQKCRFNSIIFEWDVKTNAETCLKYNIISSFRVQSLKH